MIDKKQVQHIAHLARLKLSEQEVEKMQKDLSAILDYFKTLDEVDVSNVEPLFYSQGLKNVMREDVAKKCDDHVFDQAPEKEGKHVKVKQVLENYES